jgi:hypothetical protein
VGKILVFWILLFAHLLADYPLQSNWIVNNKNRAAVLFLHVATHFLISLVFVLLYVPRAWPFLFLLALIHFIIDAGKNFVNQAKPDWVIIPYIVDQFLHVLSIILIAFLVARFTDVPPFAIQPTWLILLIAYLVVTYVWYISERIIAFHNPSYFQQVVNKEWSRMLARAIFLTLAIIGLPSLSSYVGVLALIFPYKMRSFGIRALITDIFIAGCGAIFVLGFIE